MTEAPGTTAAAESQREPCYRRAVKRSGKPIDPALGRISTLGGLLGIKSGPLLARLAPITGECSGDLVATIPHAFDALAVTVTVGRDTARTLCGEWLDALPGDELALELDATTVTAHSDEAALPPDAPELVRQLGDELAAVGWDGTTWSYVIAQPNPDAEGCEATIARIEQVATALGVTEPQRRIAATLHRSLARGMVSRAWVQARAGAVLPALGLVWDRVEWLPIQHMLNGFYPALGGAAKIDRLSRALEVDDATVELILGPTDPPALRFSVRLAGP
jgi:hypothetical protein